MTRQHFKAFADALKAERPGEHWNANKKVQWDLDCKAVAKVCAQFNSNFKLDTFLVACGGLFNA